MSTTVAKSTERTIWPPNQDLEQTLVLRRLSETKERREHQNKQVH